MKKFLIIVAALILFQQWETLHDVFVPPKDYSYLGATYVTMYSTDWCRYCAKTRHFLEKNQIAYKDLDIEKSKQARQQYDSLGGGGVPLLVVNDRLIRGYDPTTIVQYLDEIDVPVTL